MPPRFALLYLRYLGEIDEVAIYDGPVSAATFSGRINMVEGIIADDGANSNPVDPVGGLTVQLDAAGNLISDSDARTYRYNNAGRFVEVLDNGIQTASYVHNALGQRTQKTVGDSSTVYLYDLNGQLIAEHDGTGTLIRDYVWLNGQPVAQVDQGEYSRTCILIIWAHHGWQRMTVRRWCGAGTVMRLVPRRRMGIRMEMARW